MNDALYVFGLTTSPLELISFLLSVITVVLTIRQTHWAWLFAIVSSATYAFVFFDARLYGDMGLQAVFVSVSAWGWYQWLHGGARHAPLQVSHANARQWALGLFGWLLGFALLAAFLAHFTNTDVPYIDGFLTAGSLLGQLLLSRKKIENWIVWIVVDVLYVGLYVYKDLMLTAILYTLFIGLAYIGLRTWRRAEQAQARP